MDPGGELGLAGAVGHATVAATRHGTMGLSDTCYRLFDFGERAKGRRRHIRGRAGEPAERIGHVAGVIGDPGNDLGMHSLNQQGSHAADEGRSVTDDPPAHRFGAEEPRIARVVEGAGEWILGMSERIGGAVDDAIAISVDD